MTFCVVCGMRNKKAKKIVEKLVDKTYVVCEDCFE